MTVIFGVWFQMKSLNLQELEKNACGSEMFGSDHQGADNNSLSSSSSSLLLLFLNSDEGHIS